MDRVKVDHQYLNKLEVPTDMPDLPWIQWRVENLEEFSRFIEDQIVNRLGARMRVVRAPGDQLILQTHVFNSDLQISPGDCLVIHEQGGQPRLGLVRARSSVPIREADGIKDHNNPIFMAPKDKIISH